jgi:cytochrome c oxidase subunit 3
MKDIIVESTILGFHTRAVQKGIRLGIVLFIVSEIMFFFAFFWAFFHSSLSPSVQIGCVWPPAGITPFSPWGIPLLNTLILLLSGFTLTIVHYSIISGNGVDAFNFYICTLILAVCFTLFQVYEYFNAPFDISSGIYGSTFFMLTGLHGVHVFGGSVAILISFIRTSFLNHFTREHHIGFEGAAWYWHFVDVVWLLLFISVYWWGGRLEKNLCLQINFYGIVYLNKIHAYS